MTIFCHSKKQQQTAQDNRTGCGLQSKTQGLFLLLFLSMTINVLLSVSLAFCILAQNFPVQKHCYNTAVQDTHFGILNADNVSIQGSNVLSERIKTITEQQNNLMPKYAMHSWQIGSKKLRSLDSWPSAILQPLSNVSAIGKQYNAIMELITPNNSIIVLNDNFAANTPIRSGNHHSKAASSTKSRSAFGNTRKSSTAHKRPKDRLQRQRTFSSDDYATNPWTYEAQMANSINGDRFEEPLSKSGARRNYGNSCNRNVAPATTLPNNQPTRIERSSLHHISAYAESSDSDIVMVDTCNSERSDSKHKVGQNDESYVHGHAANTRKVPSDEESYGHGHAANTRKVPTSQKSYSHGHAANTRKVPTEQHSLIQSWPCSELAQSAD